MRIVWSNVSSIGPSSERTIIYLPTNIAAVTSRETSNIATSYPGSFLRSLGKGLLFPAGAASGEKSLGTKVGNIEI